MAKESLAVKYRPKSFDDLTEQTAIKDILTEQINTKTFQHAYLFTGPAGTGKTTSARIFANMINNGKGNPIEVDAASNSGVDNIRNIIDDSKKKPLDAEYKIYIVDECHSLSNGAWQAMLKLLEEPPKFSIFILCTTNPEKIPPTILSRVQRFQFNKISTDGIFERLLAILSTELGEGGYEFDSDALHYIARISEGGMRDAITTMDKCLSLSKELTLENVLKAMGSEDYSTFFDLLEYVVDKDIVNCIEIIENVYNSGKDIKQFMKQFGKFIIDVLNATVFGNMKYCNIPNTSENTQKIEHMKDFNIIPILNTIVELNNQIKWDSDPKTLIEQTLFIYSEE